MPMPSQAAGKNFGEREAKRGGTNDEVVRGKKSALPARAGLKKLN